MECQSLHGDGAVGAAVGHDLIILFGWRNCEMEIDVLENGLADCELKRSDWASAVETALDIPCFCCYFGAVVFGRWVIELWVLCCWD